MSVVRTSVDNAIDEDVAWYQTVVVLVHFAEQIRQARLFVVHELEESFAPVVPAELTNALHVLQVHQVFVQTTLALPRQHPNVTPLVPKLMGARRTEFNISSGRAVNCGIVLLERRCF